ncbi:hypothetical protein FE697_014895 [Mumia zhuanghuii]|uniref:Uncharacterized protein n=2 Tax=Mumia TaxID=1546255 RepID=A0ABW1QV56_9ACTN|nr:MULTISPECIES: hypothetical protein [Mumia]KAA1422431.1 hypothetical protein FE697_014895 [Mumia zhuanghuii]
MTLRPLTDLGPADWLAAADSAGFDVVSLGAPGFDAYVRLLHPLDPDDDEEQAALNVEGDLGEALLASLCEVLARHTTTPDHAYFCRWDEEQLDSGRRLLIGGRESARAYLVFEGPLAEAGHWGGHPVHGWINSPNLLWPADRAWCFATEIDLPWTGIGGPQALIDELHTDDRFDVVHCDPRTDQPYR